MDKVTYYLNWMGPINVKWIETNGKGWSGGRIDISDGSDYGSELCMPVVSHNTWYHLREFLDELETEGAYSYGQIVAAFEEAGGVMEYWQEPDEWVLNQGGDDEGI